jgi:hypothetical protein
MTRITSTPTTITAKPVSTTGGLGSACAQDHHPPQVRLAATVT